MSDDQHKLEQTRLLNELMTDINLKPLHPKNKILLYNRYVLPKLAWHFTVTKLSKTWIYPYEKYTCHMPHVNHMWNWNSHMWPTCDPLVTHMWHVTRGMCRVACGVWHVTCGMWRVACDVWHVTCGMWHVTCDMWMHANSSWLPHIWQRNHICHIYIIYTKLAGYQNIYCIIKCWIIYKNTVIVYNGKFYKQK